MDDDTILRISNLSAEKRALLAHRLRQKNKAESTEAILGPRSTSGACPVSFSQQRFWFLNQLEPGSTLYHIMLSMQLRGPLNTSALQFALNSLVSRHEALRTTFSCENGTPMQTIRESATIDLEIADLSSVPSSERENAVNQKIRAMERRPFDLTNDVMIRAMLLRSSPEEHNLVLAIHHIAADGWSLRILWREFIELYKERCTGTSAALPETRIHYDDYSVWQRKWLQGETLDRQLTYWKQKLADAPPLLDLPIYQSRPTVQTFNGAYATAEYSVELAQKIKALAEREDATSFMILLAAFKVLLMRYSGQEDVIVGSPIAGRNRVETENIVGCFVNSLPMRTDLSGNPTFKEALRRVRNMALEVYSNQDVPFEKLVEQLQLRRNPGHPSLLQVMFSYRNDSAPQHKIDDLSLSLMDIRPVTSKFEMTLFIDDYDDGLRVAIEYNTDLFLPEFIASMLQHLRVLLEGVVTQPEQRVWDYPILTKVEKKVMVSDWNNFQLATGRDLCVQHAFESKAAAKPDAIALIIGEKTINYGELNRRANKLAHHLRRHGVGPDVLVGICADRSIEMIVGLLAILKAGGAFVPLDPEYPRERLEFMLSDTKTPILLVSSHLRERLPVIASQTIALDGLERFDEESDANPAFEMTSENLAYVMYTSGSTGRPKGVCIPHHGVIRLVKNANYVELSSDEVILQFAPISFDASTFEIWGALLNGAKLVMFPERRASINELEEVVKRYRVSTLWLTAGLFHQIVDKGLEGLKGVRQLLAGGDVLSPPHVQKAVKALPNTHIINGYGPTENTTFTCCFTVPESERAIASIPIGRAISKTQVYILDRSMNPVPIGVAGEIYIGGVGLARGYHNRPEMTASTFIPSPFETGARIYRTGDQGRYRLDGAIEFLGRIDNQIKIRGFRIELGEIETALLNHDSVKEAVVISRPDANGDKRLIAYVVHAPGKDVNIDELSQFLSRKLPSYMIPSQYAVLNAFPLSPNGKVDRKKLPDPKENSRVSAGGTKPWLAVQYQLMQIWEQLLGKNSIGLNDDFFDLGGHSLLAVRMVHQIERVFGAKLPLTKLFDAPTIEGLSRLLIEGANAFAAADIVKVQAGSRGRRPFFYLDGDLAGGGLYCRNLAQLMGPDQPFYALRPHVGESNAETSIEEQAAQRLKILRATQSNGPYLLGGFCIDALVAFEIACQLQKAGQTVEMLVLVDPPNCPNSLRWAARLVNGVDKVWKLQPSTRFQCLKRVMGMHDLLSLRLAGKWKKIRDRLERMASSALRGAGKERAMLKNSAESEQTEMSQNVLEAQIWSASLFQPTKFNGAVNIFVSGETMNDVKYSPHQWTHLVDRLEMHPIPGEHLSLITRNSEVLAKELKSCLLKATGCAPSGRVSECLLSAS